MKWSASCMTLEMASRSLLRSLGMKTSGEVCHQTQNSQSLSCISLISLTTFNWQQAALLLLSHTNNVHSIFFFFFWWGVGMLLHPKIASKERLLDSLELTRNQQENFPRVSHLALPMLLRLSSLAMSACLTTAGGDDITNHSSA